MKIRRQKRFDRVSVFVDIGLVVGAGAGEQIVLHRHPSASALKFLALRCRTEAPRCQQNARAPNRLASWHFDERILGCSTACCRGVPGKSPSLIPKTCS